MRLDSTFSIRTLLASAALFAAATGTGFAADMGTPAKPEDPKWFFKIGPGGVLFNSSAELSTPLGRVTGASARASNNLAALFGVGYFVTDTIALELGAGIPPTTALDGRGTAAPLGTLGKVTYGPATLTATYHFKDFGAIQPYVGVGGAYAIVFDAKDGSVTNLSVKGAPAFVLQAGVDYAIDRHWAAFVDVKHLFLSVDATGNIGPTPVTAKVRLDPTVVFTGIAYRF
jgi:outer membrane protein